MRLKNEAAKFIVAKDGVLHYTTTIPIKNDDVWVDFLGTGIEVFNPLEHDDLKALEEYFPYTYYLSIFEKYAFDVGLEEFRYDIDDKDEEVFSVFSASASEIKILYDLYSSGMKFLFIDYNGSCKASKNEALRELCYAYEIDIEAIKKELKQDSTALKEKMSFAFNKIINGKAMFTPILIDLERWCNDIYKVDGVIRRSQLYYLQRLFAYGITQSIYIDKDINEAFNIKEKAVRVINARCEKESTILYSKNGQIEVFNDDIYISNHKWCIEKRKHRIDRNFIVDIRLQYISDYMAKNIEHNYIKYLLQEVCLAGRGKDLDLFQSLDLIITEPKVELIIINEIADLDSPIYPMPRNSIAIISKVEKISDDDYNVTLNFDETAKHNNSLINSFPVSGQYVIKASEMIDAEIIAESTGEFSKYLNDPEDGSFTEYLEKRVAYYRSY